jgi:hypothetical protein
MTEASFVASIERSQIRKRHNRNRASAHALEIFGIAISLFAAWAVGAALAEPAAAARLRASPLIPTSKKRSDAKYPAQKRPQHRKEKCRG